MIASVLTILILAAITYRHFRRQERGVMHLYFPALVLKIASGMALGWLYLNHYGAGDTISYWLDGNLAASSMWSSPKETLGFFWDESNTALSSALSNQTPRSVFFVKIAALFSLMGGGNYWMISVIPSWLSFMAAWFLFAELKRWFPHVRAAAALAFLFFPSVVFWSSGLIKESIGMAALFVLAALALRWLMEKKWSMGYLISLPALWIGWNLKYYWMGIFMPVVVTTLIVDVVTGYRISLKKYDWIIWLGLFACLLIVATSIHPNFYPARFAEVIYQNNTEFMRMSPEGHAVHFDGLTPSLTSVLLHAPEALVAGLFRPFLWETFNALSLVASLENLVIVVLLVTCLLSWKQWADPNRRVLLLAVIMYIGLLCIFLTLSTPNFGTLSRYKVGFLPFLVLLIAAGSPLTSRFARILGRH